MHRVGCFPPDRLGSCRKTHGAQTGHRRAQSLRAASHARKMLRASLLWPRVILAFDARTAGLPSPIYGARLSLFYFHFSYFLFKTSLLYALLSFHPSPIATFDSHLR